MNAPAHIPASKQWSDTESEQIAAIAKASEYLTVTLQRGLPRHSETVLWAQWDFHKALLAFHGEDVGDRFDEVCNDLKVDADGDDLAEVWS